MKHIWSWIALGTLALTVVGCNASGEKKAETTGSGATNASGAKALKVGIVFDSGGRGDKSFNDSAFAGIERAKKEYGIEVKEVQTKSEKDYETNQSALAEAGMDLVICVGLNQETALKKVAASFPEQKFTIVDGKVEAGNVRMLRFREEEGSFLVGYLAGLMSTTGKIGFVGGMNIPLIAKFQYGYAAGARMANPKIEILPAKFTDNWDDTQKAKAAAGILFSGGADIVYHAAGRAGLGVITAAKEANKFAIGVDSDQDDIEPGRVLTSMVKRVDEAVYQTITDLKNGKFSPGEVIYDLKMNGVGLSELKHTKDVIGAEKLAKVDEIKKKIIAGEIQVPATETAYNAFVGTLK